MIYDLTIENLDLDLLAGVTKDELGGIKKSFNKSVTENDFKEFIAVINTQMVHKLLNATKIIEYYLNNVGKNNSDAIKWRMGDFYSDLLLKCPTYLFTRLYASNSNGANVYFYELTHSSKGAANEKQFGIEHGADLDFVFGLPLLKPNAYSKEDFEFSKQVVMYWTNFAKYGIPDSVNWPSLIEHEHEHNEHYVTMTRDLHPGTKSSLIGDFLKSNCDGFWRDYYLGDEE